MGRDRAAARAVAAGGRRGDRARHACRWRWPRRCAPPHGSRSERGGAPRPRRGRGGRGLGGVRGRAGPDLRARVHRRGAGRAHRPPAPARLGRADGRRRGPRLATSTRSAGHQPARAAARAGACSTPSSAPPVGRWPAGSAPRPPPSPAGAALGPARRRRGRSLAEADAALAAGAARLRVKIAPGTAAAPARPRCAPTSAPDVALQADANGTFSLDDPAHLAELDQLDERRARLPRAAARPRRPRRPRPPGRAAAPRRSASTSRSRRSAPSRRPSRSAPARSCASSRRRVGGWIEARRVHDRCVELGVPVWVGGMLETAIGRAANARRSPRCPGMALAARPRPAWPLRPRPGRPAPPRRRPASRSPTAPGHRRRARPPPLLAGAERGHEHQPALDVDARRRAGRRPRAHRGAGRADAQLAVPDLERRAGRRRRAQVREPAVHGVVQGARRAATSCSLLGRGRAGRGGVVAMSAGNHAQAVARHAARLGIDATIVMPATTPFVKVHRTRCSAPRVVLHGDDLADATAEARRIAAAEGRVARPPLRRPRRSSPARAPSPSSCSRTIPSSTRWSCRSGGGGLLAGMAVVAKALRPDLVIVGVQSERWPSMLAAVTRPRRCRRAAARSPTASPCPAPGTVTAPLVADLVDELVTVTDDAVEERDQPAPRDREARGRGRRRRRPRRAARPHPDAACRRPHRRRRAIRRQHRPPPARVGGDARPRALRPARPPADRGDRRARQPRRGHHGARAAPAPTSWSSPTTACCSTCRPARPSSRSWSRRSTTTTSTACWPPSPRPASPPRSARGPPRPPLSGRDGSGGLEEVGPQAADDGRRSTPRCAARPSIEPWLLVDPSRKPSIASAGRLEVLRRLVRSSRRPPRGTRA